MDEGSKAAKIDITREIKTTLLVPGAELTTETARSVLPSDVPRGDATFNASRAVMLVLVPQGRSNLFLEAADDRLHQRYRADSMSESAEVLWALRRAEWPAVISGAGPSVFVLDKLDRRARSLLAIRGFRSIAVGIDSGAYLIEGSQ